MYFIISVYVSVWIYVHTCACGCQPKEVIRHPGDGVTGYCEPSDMGVWNQTLVLWESNMVSPPPLPILLLFGLFWGSLDKLIESPLNVLCSPGSLWACLSHPSSWRQACKIRPFFPGSISENGLLSRSLSLSPFLHLKCISLSFSLSVPSSSSVHKSQLTVDITSQVNTITLTLEQRFFRTMDNCSRSSYWSDGLRHVLYIVVHFKAPVLFCLSIPLCNPLQWAAYGSHPCCSPQHTVPGRHIFSFLGIPHLSLTHSSTLQIPPPYRKFIWALQTHKWGYIWKVPWWLGGWFCS